MYKATIFKKTILQESDKSQFALSVNNCNVDISSNHLKIYRNNEKILDSELVQTENEFHTSTYEGQYKDGEKFRVIRPKEIPLQDLKQEFGCQDAFSLASVTPVGYAVHFTLK